MSPAVPKSTMVLMMRGRTGEVLSKKEKRSRMTTSLRQDMRMTRLLSSRIIITSVSMTAFSKVLSSRMRLRQRQARRLR